MNTASRAYFLIGLLSMSGCSYIRGVFYPDYHTQRYRSHAYVKHTRSAIANRALQRGESTFPYNDHPDLFSDSATSSAYDSLVDVSVIARPAEEPPQRVSPLVLQLSERAQQALVQNFGGLGGDLKKLVELLQTLRKEQAAGEKKGKAPRFDVAQKVEFDIATTLNTGTDGPLGLREYIYCI